MSDISPKGGTVQDSAEIYRLLRERFAPLARFGGPLYAGDYSNEGISGGLYVGELNQWLWVPETVGRHRPEDALPSDEQVAAARDLAATVKSLLRSAKLMFELFLEHLDRVQRKATFPDHVQTYLTNTVALVVDAMVLRGRREWIFERLKDRLQSMNRNLDEEPGDHVRLSGRCVVTGKPYSVVVPLSGAIDYFERGRNIAEAFPDLTKPEREFLISGTSPEGWI